MMPVAQTIRRRLIAQTKALKGELAVALSGGVDSCSVLAALLETGHRPWVISYTPNTHESTDFKMARETAYNMGLRFVPCFVDMDAESLEAQARYVISQGFYKKVEVESLIPMANIVAVASAIGVDTLLTVDQADGYFCLSKWSVHNYDRAMGVPFRERGRNAKEDEDPTRIDGIRKRYYELDLSCSGAVVALANLRGLECVVPYRDKRVFEAFEGLLWKDINRPRIKEPIRQAFEVWFDRGILVRPTQVNLHKGDSYFGDTLNETLTNLPHLQGNWKTPTGLYACMFRGEV